MKQAMKHKMSCHPEQSEGSGQRVAGFFATLRMTLALFGATALLAPSAFAACASPTGTGGQIDYSNDQNILQYCDGTSWMPMYAEHYWANGVTFDGTNDYLSYATPAYTNSKQWTGSFWMRMNNPGVAQILFRQNGVKYNISTNTSNVITISAVGVSGSTALTVSANAISGTGWHHVMFSFDMGDPGKRHLYIDGVSSLNTVTTYVDDTLNFSGGTNAFGSGTGGSAKFNGDIADAWLDFGTYMDLSNATNRARFIDTRGKPVWLGADGSRVTGSAPDIFLSGATASWHTNKGTGGGFTVTGALTDGIDPGGDIVNGLRAHWRLDETSGPTAADASGNGYNGTWTGSPIAVEGVIGKALSLAGTDSIPTSYSLATYPVTICSWIKYNATTSFFTELIHTSGAGPFTIYILNDTGNADLVTLYNNYVSISTPADAIRAGVWNHVCGAVDASNIATLYINGVLRAGPTNINTPVFPANITIGTFFDGLISDVRLYNRVLSLNEIKQLAGCASPFGTAGTMIYNQTAHVMQFCDGRSWLSMSEAAGNGGAGCLNPSGVEGKMIYNENYRTMQYCEGDQWIAVGKVDPCDGSPAPGTVCTDGSVYAGMISGTYKLFTTPADAPNRAWSTEQVVTGATSGSGWVNHAQIKGTRDINNYPAFLYCENLVAHGRSDWYFPGSLELSTMCNNQTAIGGFSATNYDSSDEISGNNARQRNFAACTTNNNPKPNAYKLRCARRN